MKSLIRELYNNRQLIWNLSKNDFKTKYAGSYLGIIWAFIQPIITVLVYWFVFEVGFKSLPVGEYPYLLWLVSGMVPWFFFNDGIMNAMNGLVEYSYLVKKVVFKISILPIVKIISAAFVHIFFIGFLFGLYSLYGFYPNVHFIQIFYYSGCMFVIVLGISYATSAIIIFFKDLGQLVAILLQIGMYMTPILWDLKMVPENIQWLFKINPMYYIISGYRQSLMTDTWFWERNILTPYFLIVTIVCFIGGSIIFKKSKPHFADLL